MKKQIKLIDLTASQFLAVVYTSEKLTNKLCSQIDDSYTEEANDSIADYLMGCNWEFGMYTRTYLKVTDPDSFMQGIASKIEAVGATDLVVKAYKHCQKLRDTNSNLYVATIIRALVPALEREIKEQASHYEDMSYSIYCKDVTDENLQGFVDVNILGCEYTGWSNYTLDLTTGEVSDLSTVTAVEPDQLKAIKDSQPADSDQEPQTDNLYRLVDWPDCQDFMEYEGFDEQAVLYAERDGAYFIPQNWLLNVAKGLVPKITE